MLSPLLIEEEDKSLQLLMDKAKSDLNRLILNKLQRLPAEIVLEIGFARWEADKVWDKPSDD
jgi:hypothetical protein